MITTQLLFKMINPLLNLLMIAALSFVLRALINLQLRHAGNERRSWLLNSSTYTNFIFFCNFRNTSRHANFTLLNQCLIHLSRSHMTRIQVQIHHEFISLAVCVQYLLALYKIFSYKVCLVIFTQEQHLVTLLYIRSETYTHLTSHKTCLQKSVCIYLGASQQTLISCCEELLYRLIEQLFIPEHHL